jgi:hypothetical protein
MLALFCMLAFLAQELPELEAQFIGKPSLGFGRGRSIPHFVFHLMVLSFVISSQCL